MKRLTLTTALVTLALPAWAEGTLNIYNFGLYTPPELVEKFEKTYDVKVTLTEYDSNETAMAKIEAGGHGFDIIVPSASVVPIYIEKGLLLKSDPNTMENFRNVAPDWVDVSWDSGRSYTVPYVWGTTGVMVNTDVYKGDINTSDIFLNPPEELKGKINVVPSMNDVIDMAIYSVGGEACTTDKEILKAARDEFERRTGGGIGGAKWIPPLCDYDPPIHFRWPEYVTTARGRDWWIPTRP